jgi:2-oxoglutarate dehydrogenase E2 component (dihydrolipoamide succinyltransferase)
MTNIVVPTLGESVSEATVAKWLKKEGEAVKADEPLVELETDKVTLEVNAPAAGVLMKITAAPGTAVAVGAMLGEIQAGAAAAPANDKSAAPAKAGAQAQSDPGLRRDDNVAAMPAAKKMAADNNVDLNAVAGTGKDGRVTKGDVMGAMSGMASAPHSPSPSAQAEGPVPQMDGGPRAKPEGQVLSSRAVGPREEKVKMTKLRQIIAARLKEAQNTAAMLTTFNEIDMSAVMELRAAYKDGFEKKHGVKLGFMSFFIKAAVGALREFPAVNAEIAGDEIIYKNYYDLSVAISAPQGLVVPVVRDCDQKSMAQIEKDIIDLGARARDNKLSMADMSGGTFTITNGGIFGSLMSTPIINPPQVAILGMHKIQERPMVMKDGTIKARPMMYVAMSYDHRIIDGREAVSFLVRVKEAIEDPQRILLEM